tara:strand:+ start:72 stop:1163 length:1092 start_codon:yes stop_codon:yes gene_type:complete
LKIISVVGTRPNFMKMSPVIKALDKLKIKQILVHTGQHYDNNMSTNIFKDLNLRNPDIHMDIRSGSHAKQTSKILIKFEEICIKYIPDLVVVAGDVNSTFACALSAKKLNIPIAHVEAGLRSFDMNMPEEINRVLTDKISDLLFVSEESGILNLENEGFNESNIFFVGNCMIDSLKKWLPTAKKINPFIKYNIIDYKYCLITIHRPSNVDDISSLKKIYNMIISISKKIKVVFSVHPRTNARLKEFELFFPENILLIEPLSYIDFISAMSKSKFVLTDSGGIQEETTFLGIPCLTIRENTERPSTIESGTNYLVGTKEDVIHNHIDNILNNNMKNASIPNKWDGESGPRIGKIIFDFLKYRQK